MRRVVVFQGLGVAEPREPLPPGVWQRGEPRPALDAAMWYRTDAIQDFTQFPPMYPTPPANCRMCPPGDTSPDCCVHNTKMPQFTNWGRQAYQNAVLPWNYNSAPPPLPPTTQEMIGIAMEQSLRQAQLELAPLPDAPPPNPAYQLSGFLAGGGRLGAGGQGQTRLLGAQGQTHLLGKVGCGCDGSRLSGPILGTGWRGFSSTFSLGVAGFLLTVVGGAYWAMKGKKAPTLAKVAAFGLPAAGAVIAADFYMGRQTAASEG